MKTVERTPRRWWMAAALAVALATGGCATQGTTARPAAAVDDVNDPLEPLNRYVFEVNFFLDEFLLKPLAWWYRIALPDQVQNGVNNVLQNMRTPWSFVNDLLQGETDRAGTSAARFGINTTLGVLGIFEVAEGMGFPEHDEDFGQTLAVWGVPEGFYLVLPIFGPSNPRDAIGSVVDDYGDPFNLYARIRDFEHQFPALSQHRHRHRSPGPQPGDRRRSQTDLGRFLCRGAQPLPPEPRQRDQQRPACRRCAVAGLPVRR